ncbi:hemolysin secretion protein-like [Synechococcus sp. CC9902]|uniref:HlyD family efflux transporter periplasmic adaptor subunit n=1 Tax=Synechococcus sp. (strain CC9902) TaxID=316279 RepID=UPI00005D3D0F|nr:HlyD family efflux transporter periplasmic adaptor subunit [Synechococcus sp. CC9902]ABB25093.1 hemolysin secretion protein-like [Synechococcus sp. CC9902]
MTDKKLPSADSNKFKVWEGSSVFVSQGRHWSSAFIWLSAGLLGVTVIFAFSSKIDQTVSVRGKLSPSGSVQDIESPSSGVVLDVFASDGDFVEAGDILLTVESKSLSSRLSEINEKIQLLSLEISGLKDIIESGGKPSLFKPLPPLPTGIDDAQLVSRMLTARNQVNQIRSELIKVDIRLQSKSSSLNYQTQITNDLKPLYDNGAMARNAYLDQINRLQENKAEFSTLVTERSRIVGSVSSRVNSLNQQLLSLRTQLTSVNEQIGYRNVKAPVSGRVFNLMASPYSVVSSSEKLLTIVPSNNLQALVEIPNSDIGFIKVGQAVSVSVDSFPSGEFGYIRGSLISIGSDALPPDQDSPQRYFPGTVKLVQQSVVSGDTSLNLQSGMSITANIKLRSRPTISILTDIFTRQLDGVKRFR